MEGLLQPQPPGQQTPMAEGVGVTPPPGPAGAAPAPPDDMGPESDESNPAFVEAMQLAYSTLYDKKAADKIVETLKITEDPVEGLANTAYEIASIVDERTQGEIPDDLIMSLGANMLAEVAEIAEVAGMEISPQTINDAFKQMTLRWVGEQGGDTTQLSEAMNAFTPDMIAAAHEFVDSEGTQGPPQGAAPESGAPAPPPAAMPPQGA